MKYPSEIVTAHQKRLYRQCRKNGCDEKFATMLALQQPPGVETDDSFLAGLPRADKILGDHLANHYRTVAAKHGYKAKPTDSYNPTLARFPGDPQAFINHGQSRAHIKRVCEAQGLNASGGVSVQGKEPAKDPMEDAKPLGDDIIQREVKSFEKRNPDEARKMSKSDKRAEIIHRFGPRKRSK